MLGVHYFAPDGAPLTLEEWAIMFEKRHEDMSDESWWRRQTSVGDAVVSTVWLGLDHSYGYGPPLFWETMIFGGKHDEFQWRYSSAEDAYSGHNAIVSALRAGQDPRELHHHSPHELEAGDAESNAERNSGAS